MLTGAIGNVENAAQSSAVRESWPPLADGTVLGDRRSNQNAIDKRQNKIPSDRGTSEREGGKICKTRVLLEWLSVSVHS